MQIPYPKRKVIFDGEPSKEEKPDPHKVIIIVIIHSLHQYQQYNTSITLVFDLRLNINQNCTEGYTD